MKRKRYSAEHTVAAVKQHEMGVCGLLVSDALSWEWWENLSCVAAPPTLAQEIRPAMSPGLRVRLAYPNS